MSKLGKEIIKVLKEAKKKGLVTLKASLDVVRLRKKVNSPKRIRNLVNR